MRQANKFRVIGIKSQGGERVVISRHVTSAAAEAALHLLLDGPDFVKFRVEQISDSRSASAATMRPKRRAKATSKRKKK